MLAKFFIERPVLANVLALVIMLLGGVSLFNLPVAQYPPITPPTIQVTTNYPGASAKTMVETVALPIEQQVNGVENMLYMQSTCTRMAATHLLLPLTSGPISTSRRCSCKIASPLPSRNCPRPFNNKEW